MCIFIWMCACFVYFILCYPNATVQMSADVARGHGGDGGGEDRRPPSQNPTGDCFNNRGEKFLIIVIQA